MLTGYIFFSLSENRRLRKEHIAACTVLFYVLYLKSVFENLHRIILLVELHSPMDKVSGPSPKYIQSTRKSKEVTYKCCKSFSVPGT